MNFRQASYILTLSTFIFICLSINAKHLFAAEPSFTFDPNLIYIAKNETFDAQIVIDTGNAEVGGAGTIIHFDPEVLSVVNIVPGTIFADYPTASFDNAGGLVRLSGVVSSPTTLYKGSGNFGKIKLQGKKAGSTKLTFEFAPGSTTDSNIAVTYGDGDILDHVGELTVIVTQAEVTPKVTAPLTSQPEETPTEEPQKKGLLTKILEFFGFETDSSKDEEAAVIDPTAPLISQAPNTNPSTAQPTTVPVHAQGIRYDRIFGALLIIFTLIGLLVFAIKKIKDSQKVRNVDLQ